MPAFPASSGPSRREPVARDRITCAPPGAAPAQLLRP